MATKVTDRITPASRRHHIKTAGEDRCPYCKVSVHDLPMGFDYEEPSPVEGGEIEQRVECPSCNGRWVDVFCLVDVREIV